MIVKHIREKLMSSKEKQFDANIFLNLKSIKSHNFKEFYIYSL